MVQVIHAACRPFWIPIRVYALPSVHACLAMHGRHQKDASLQKQSGAMQTRSFKCYLCFADGSETRSRTTTSWRLLLIGTQAYMGMFAACPSRFQGAHSGWSLSYAPACNVLSKRHQIVSCTKLRVCYEPLTAMSCAMLSPSLRARPNAYKEMGASCKAVTCLYRGRGEPPLLYFST